MYYFSEISGSVDKIGFLDCQFICFKMPNCVLTKIQYWKDLTTAHLIDDNKQLCTKKIATTFLSRPQASGDVHQFWFAFHSAHIMSCSAHCAVPWGKKQRKTFQKIHRKVPREDIYGGRTAMFACNTIEPVSITVYIAISSGQAKATKLTAVYTVHMNTLTSRVWLSHTTLHIKRRLILLAHSVRITRTRIRFTWH